MSFVTVSHPDLPDARVPASAVKHMERNGWRLAGDKTPQPAPDLASETEDDVSLGDTDTDDTEE